MKKIFTIPAGITCSKSTIKTIEQIRCTACLRLPIKAPERRY